MEAFIRKHKLLTELAILVLLCILMLTAMEIRQPYFFLQDDNADSYICQYAYSLKSVLQGEFPLYNFHQFSGIGFLDRGQTGQLNPLMYVGGFLSYLFLKHFDGTIDFMAAIYLISGAIGMYLVLKRIGLSKTALFIGSIAWSFNSFAIYCGSNWIIAIILTGCLPWIILTSQKLIKEDGIKSIVFASIAKTFLFYGGHPQYFIYAIIFDFIFAISVLVAYENKEIRLKSALRFTGKYALSGLLTALWSLPLLVPMISSMNNSATRSDALVFDDFIENLFKISDFILSQYNPLIQHDVTTIETTPDGNPIAVIEALVAIQKNMAHVGYIVFFAAVLGIVIIVTRFKAKDNATHNSIVKMLVCLPSLIIAFLWASSSVFNRIIYLIPILNRFRYPFKVMQYAIFFLIVLACICIDYLLSEFSKNHSLIVNVLKILLPIIEAVNLTLVYILLPVRYFGTYTLSQKPFTDEAVDLLKGSRYVFVAGAPQYWDFYTYERVGQDATASLGYNYATYFGLSNIGGYDVLLSSQTCYSLYEMLENMSNVSGNVKLYDNLVPDMSAHGVAYYVCLIENVDEVSQHLNPYGIELCYEDDVKAIFYDPLAEPLVYVVNDDDAYAINYEEHVNYLKAETNEDFDGGMIVFNYTHNSQFVATIDGQEVAIEDQGDFAKMILNNVPSGSHEIVVRYIDKSFEYCLWATLGGTVIIIISILIIKNKKK